MYELNDKYYDIFHTRLMEQIYQYKTRENIHMWRRKFKMWRLLFLHVGWTSQGKNDFTDDHIVAIQLLIMYLYRVNNFVALHP